MPAQKTNKPFETDMPRKVIEFKSNIRNAVPFLLLPWLSSSIGF